MGIYVGTGRINYPATRGPCPYGYHVPTSTELTNLLDAGYSCGAWINKNTSGDTTNLITRLKLPLAGNRMPHTTGNAINQGSYGYYHCCNQKSDTQAQSLLITSTIYNPPANTNQWKGQGMSIRPFKDIAIIPDSSWTTIYEGTGSSGVYWNSSLGLISVSGDGTTWYTIADKNLGATSVYNYGDTLSESNCGKYYQWGNNYGFPRTGSVTSSTTKVDASAYGPGNWYYSSTYIAVQANWSSVTNSNLRGGVVGLVKADVKDICVGAGVDDYSAMQGPCPDGFHIPTSNEWSSINGAGISLGAWAAGTGGNNVRIYLKMPFAGDRNYNGSIRNQGTEGGIWLLNVIDNNRALTTVMQSNYLSTVSITKSLGRSIRPMKNNPVVPDSTWTTLYNGSSVATGAGIFWSKGLGLISISSNGTTRYTIADKNLGANVVYNNGDTLSQDNCGLYYQYGNNYGFPYTGTVTTSSTLVDASGYGPGNYYTSNIFTSATSNPYGWDSSYNYNIRGYTTGIQKKGNVKQVYVGTTPVRPTYNPGIYWNKAKGLISMSSDGENWITIADKNLGAKTTDTSSADSYGWYYQFGNNYGFPASGFSTSTSQVNLSSYGPTNPYYSTTFIKNSSGIDSSANTGIWGTESDMKSRQGPCPEGFHISLYNNNNTDRRGVLAILKSLSGQTNITWDNLASRIKLPKAGYIQYSNGTRYSSGSKSRSIIAYRTTRPSYLYGTGSDASVNNVGGWYACPIRPFKNEPVVPDNSRAVLYKPS